MTSEFSLFYTTWPEESLARHASQTLLQEKLAACTNLLPGMESHYWWQGKLETSKECILILKTRSELKAQLINRLEGLHPYDTPCILEIAVTDGNYKYLNWLNQSLK